MILGILSVEQKGRKKCLRNLVINGLESNIEYYLYDINLFQSWSDTYKWKTLTLVAYPKVQ